MKKIYLYIAILSSLLTGLASCGDNEDFSTLHVLTPDEIAEQRRQDSILDAQKNKINADLILTYSVDVTISSALYDGTSLTIDLDKIAELFGITKEELLAGIAGETGAPEIKGFAISGKNNVDVGSATNTNSPWGHWWAADSTVTTWGETAMTFNEFDTETGVFNVGQYPGHLVDGQKVRAVECLKYNEKRVAVVINVNAKAPGKITATVVRTQDLVIDVVAKTGNDYGADSLQFNLTQALSDLGVASMADVKYVAVNEDGSFNGEALTDPKNGFWYDMNGFAGSYGDNASLYTAYGDFLEDKIGIGQFPGHLTGGQSITIQYGLMANNKIVMLKIKVNINSYIDPETPPAGDPTAITQDISMSKPYSDDYAKIKVDIKDLLRDAFKKTTYQIHQAILSGELKLYQGAVSQTDPAYTADVPGYWLKADGTAGEWADGLVWCSIGHSETELYLFGGNHPGNAVAGNTVNSVLIATYNGGTATFNITFNITQP
jgi:hypothetical protein